MKNSGCQTTYLKPAEIFTRGVSWKLHFQLLINAHTTSTDAQHVICFITDQNIIPAGATIPTSLGSTEVCFIENQVNLLLGENEVWTSFWCLPRPTHNKRTRFRMERVLRPQDGSWIIFWKTSSAVLPFSRQYRLPGITLSHQIHGK